MDLGEVQSLVARGRYLSAIQAAADIEAEAARPPAERMEALLLACQAAHHLSLHSRQAELARSALPLCDGPVAQARVRVAMGVAALELGDPYEAEEHLLAALATDLPDEYIAGAHYNLGRTYERMRRWDPALSSYRQAIGLWTGARPQLALLAHQQAAWVLLVGGHPAEAMTHLSAAAGLLTAADPRRQADQLALEAFARRLSGQTAEAVRMAEDLLQPGHPGASDWDRCFALWLTADIAADQNEPELARSLLDQAYRYTDGARDPALWNRLGDLRRRLGTG